MGKGDRRGGLGWEGARPWWRRRVRAEEVGPGGRSAHLCSFVCRRPAHTPHPLVGEAQETTKEFDREAFWRRLSECLSYWRLLSLLSSLLLSFPFRPAPASLRGYSSLPILGTKTLIFGGVFETSQRAGVERERIIFKVRAAVAALSFWH